MQHRLTCASVVCAPLLQLALVKGESYSNITRQADEQVRLSGRRSAFFCGVPCVPSLSCVSYTVYPLTRVPVDCRSDLPQMVHVCLCFPAAPLPQVPHQLVSGVPEMLGLVEAISKEQLAAAAAATAAADAAAVGVPPPQPPPGEPPASAAAAADGPGEEAAAAAAAPEEAAAEAEEAPTGDVDMQQAGQAEQQQQQ